MPTPYDNHDPGYSRADRRIAADYGVDIDAPEQVQCGYCNKLAEADDLNDAGKCPVCVAERIFSHQLAAEFLTSPTLAGCLGLMHGQGSK